MIIGSGNLRTRLARLAMAAGILCGALGVLAGAQDVVWKFGSTGWFTGGSLLTLLGIFELIDGAIARQRFDVAMPPADTAVNAELERPVWRPPSPSR